MYANTGMNYALCGFTQVLRISCRYTHFPYQSNKDYDNTWFIKDTVNVEAVYQTSPTPSPPYYMLETQIAWAKNVTISDSR